MITPTSFSCADERHATDPPSPKYRLRSGADGGMTLYTMSTMRNEMVECGQSLSAATGQILLSAHTQRPSRSPGSITGALLPIP